MALRSFAGGGISQRDGGEGSGTGSIVGRRGSSTACYHRFNLDASWLLSSKYGDADLAAALTDIFQHRTLGLAQNRLIIPSINMTNGQTKVFKTPHLPKHYIDRNLRVVDVVLATTAAPTYFPHAVIQKGSRYVDGGLWANNPSMVALVESIRISRECNRPDIDPRFQTGDTHMLSIGTGSSTFFADPPSDAAGIAWWARALDLISISQSQGATSRHGQFWTTVTNGLTSFFPDSSWRLDSVNFLEQMIHNGHQMAGRGANPFGAAFSQRIGTPLIIPSRTLPEAKPTAPLGRSRIPEVRIMDALEGES